MVWLYKPGPRPAAKILLAITESEIISNLPLICHIEEDHDYIIGKDKQQKVLNARKGWFLQFSVRTCVAEGLA